MNISIFYEKQDSYKTIKDLTYHIGNVGVELKESNQNRQDIDIASFTYNDAKYIRKEIQVNNEDIYYLYIYINVYAEDIKVPFINIDSNYASKANKEIKNVFDIAIDAYNEGVQNELTHVDIDYQKYIDNDMVSTALWYSIIETAVVNPN